MLSADDSDYESDSDVAVDPRQHASFVKNILNLNRKRHVSKPLRTEASLQVSEFNLVKPVASDDAIKLDELTKTLEKRGSLSEVSKRLKKVKRETVLPKPLEKPKADRIRRTVGYEKSRHELDKWDAVVEAHRAAEHLKFPMNTDLKLKVNERPKWKFRVKSDLEKEIEAIKAPTEVYTIELEKEVPLTMKEIMAKRREAAKLRAHMSFKESKARQQNKIKSKKYHRIQRRERIKKQLAEFELLQKTNPEAALQKLEEIERARAEERVTLRHKGTGKWAKTKQIRAKYDKESRKVLAEQLAISKDLTRKTETADSSDSDAEVNGSHLASHTQNNPWIQNGKTETEVDQFLSGYRKFWENENKKQLDNPELPTVEKHKNEESENDTVGDKIIDKPALQNNDSLKTSVVTIVPGGTKKNLKHKKCDVKNRKKILKAAGEFNTTTLSTSDWDVSSIHDEIGKIFDHCEQKLAAKLQNKYNNLKNMRGKNPKRIKREKKKHTVDLSIPKVAKRPIIDEELRHSDDENENTDAQNATIEELKAIIGKTTTEVHKTPAEKDASKKTEIVQLNTKLPDILITDENEDDFQRRQMIAGAFEDEDIVDEFRQEKRADVEKNNPKNIDLSLPGWGSWGGKDLPLVKKRKRKRFIIKAPKRLPRRDENKGSVIIYEGGNESVKSHLVSVVPFPFKTVKDFEASIRAPIGNTFVPETVFKKLTLPPIATKMGVIIEPLSEDILLKDKYNLEVE